MGLALESRFVLPAVGHNAQIPYGMTVTIEAGTALPVYQQVQAKLRVRLQP
jgi:hypothetical protein